MALPLPCPCHAAQFSSVTVWWRLLATPMSTWRLLSSDADNGALSRGTLFDDVIGRDAGAAALASL